MLITVSAQNDIRSIPRMCFYCIYLACISCCRCFHVIGFKGTESVCDDELHSKTKGNSQQWRRLRTHHHHVVFCVCEHSFINVHMIFYAPIISQSYKSGSLHIARVSWNDFMCVVFRLYFSICCLCYERERIFCMLVWQSNFFPIPQLRSWQKNVIRCINKKWNRVYKRQRFEQRQKCSQVHDLLSHFTFENFEQMNTIDEHEHVPMLTLKWWWWT